MEAALLDRIAAALAVTTPTPDLAALLIEAGGEQCWQRGRLLRRLTNILHSFRPPMSQSTTHRFKPGFKDTEAIINDPDTRVVNATNLTDADVPLLQQYGYGHLIEPIAKKADKAEAAEPAALTELTSLADQTIADVDAATPKKKKH